VSFAKYAALVKNLRGVVLFDPSEPGVESSLGWLVKRFRYRNLGVTQALLGKHRERLAEHLGGRPFRELVLPVPSLEKVPGLLAGALGVPAELAELLVYASTYISPALLIGERYLEDTARIAVGSVRVCREMDAGSWKLHLRIADYTALDFYEKCVDEAFSILGGADPQPVLKSRVERVKRDMKRYWRIACPEGRPFLSYVDNLKLAVEAGVHKRLELEAAAALSIVPVVLVPPGLGQQ
jgi:hypothetical protein